jgi:hypothetical protein
VTIAGKLHRGEPLGANSHFGEREWLRRGAEAARLLADELARLVEPEGAPEQLSTAERIARAGARYTPEERRMIEEAVDRALEERDL